MSCSVCAGYDSFNCPSCGQSTRMVTCPECDGKGVIYFAFDIRHRKFKRVTELAYTILPENEDEADYLNMRWCQGCIECCDVCDGEGEIYDDF